MITARAILRKYLGTLDTANDYDTSHMASCMNKLDEFLRDGSSPDFCYRIGTIKMCSSLRGQVRDGQ